MSRKEHAEAYDEVLGELNGMRNHGAFERATRDADAATAIQDALDQMPTTGYPLTNRATSPNECRTTGVEVWRHLQKVASIARDHSEYEVAGVIETEFIESFVEAYRNEFDAHPRDNDPFA